MSHRWVQATKKSGERIYVNLERAETMTRVGDLTIIDGSAVGMAEDWVDPEIARVQEQPEQLLYQLEQRDLSLARESR